MNYRGILGSSFKTKQMTKIRITPKFIKEYIELLTDEKDLANKSRKQYIVYLRSVCFKLTRELCTELSYEKIASYYGKDHATVIHGLKIFDNFKDQKHFRKEMKIYNDAKSYFLSITEDEKHNQLKALQTKEELRQEYLEKMNKITLHYRSIINKQKKIINSYGGNEMFEKIARLPYNEYKDLETRINAFFMMNAMNSQRKKQRKVLLSQ
jgi:hypothetical protein